MSNFALVFRDYNLNKKRKSQFTGTSVLSFPLMIMHDVHDS